MLPPTVADPPEAPTPRSADRRLRLLAFGVVALLVLVVAAVVELARDDRPGAPPGSWTLVPHRGLGAWVDVYDWTEELGGPVPAVGPDEIDDMAAAGVQTLYLQTGHDRVAEAVIEPERLDELIDRAHGHDMHVVAWYLPTFTDVDRDLERLLAAAELRVDGLGVDIEATDVADPAERNRRTMELTTRLRAALPEDKPMVAITLSAVHVQVVNPDYWPAYPWAELASAYDAILPMAYWSIRLAELRDGARYVGENIDRIRASAGPDVPIHPIGGIADEATIDDIDGMVSALTERGAIGASLYDWDTSRPEQWDAMQPVRDLRDASGSQA